MENWFPKVNLELPKPFGSPRMIWFAKLSIVIDLDVGKFASPFCCLQWLVVLEIARFICMP